MPGATGDAAPVSAGRVPPLLLMVDACPMNRLVLRSARLRSTCPPRLHLWPGCTSGFTKSERVILGVAYEPCGGIHIPGMVLAHDKILATEGACLVLRLIAMRPVDVHKCTLHLVKGLHLPRSTLILTCAQKGFAVSTPRFRNQADKQAQGPCLVLKHERNVVALTHSHFGGQQYLHHHTSKSYIKCAACEGAIRVQQEGNTAKRK